MKPSSPSTTVSPVRHSTSEHPIRRNVRLVLLNERAELLMMKIELPDRSFWCTIGGGIEPNETYEQAAHREVKEEIGFDNADLDIGPVIWQGEHLLERNGVLMRHQEQFVLASTQREQLSAEHMTDEEKTVVKAFRWWSLSDLKTTSEFIVPPSLVRHLELILEDQIPAEAITIALGDDPDEDPMSNTV